MFELVQQVVTRRIGCSSFGGAGLAVTVIVNSLLLLVLATTAADCHRHQQHRQPLIKVNPNRYTPPQQQQQQHYGRYQGRQLVNPLFLHPSEEEIDLLLHYADADDDDHGHIISSGSNYEEEEGDELYIDADFDAAFDWHWRNHDVLHANGGPPPHAAVALNHDYNHPHHHLPRQRQHPDQHRQHLDHYSSSSSWPNVSLFYGDLLKSSHFRRGRAVRDYLRATTRQRPPQHGRQHRQHYHQLAAALGGGGHDSSPILFIAVRE